MSSLAESLAHALVNSRESFTAAIVESCPVPMFVANQQGSWIHVNLHYQRILLRKSQDIYGDNWKKTLHPEERETFSSQWQHVITHRLSAQHLYLRHVQPRPDHYVAGYMNVGYVPGAGFIGWFVPICVEPVQCPIHEHLLRNVVISSTGSTVSAAPALANGT